ncbi:MAG: DUF1015 domain-containing protein [Gemmatimonadetes bacterium]|nr:DUF1015 domain-containing protein [Gemmatimonadota bacterium]
MRLEAGRGRTGSPAAERGSGVSVRPVPRALVPRDPESARRISAPNYDEFQSDLEVLELIRSQPQSVLRITMPHCDVRSPEELLTEDSDEALGRAAANLATLAGSDLVRTVRDILWVYEIEDRRRPAVRQIGLGGLVPVSDIRSEPNPRGPIIRNERIREAKARGRARLIERTRAIMDSVNLAVEDGEGKLAEALAAYADARPPDYDAGDDRGNRHHIWLVEDGEPIEELSALLATEPHAFVADGNHRSAAAAMVGIEGFLGVFFPADTMGIAPYNRLVRVLDVPVPDLEAALKPAFHVEPLEGVAAYQPTRSHEIGLYAGGRWLRLEPRPGTWDPADAAGSIDADIVQRHLFAGVFGISDPSDERLTFVGGNRDARYLRRQVDAGEYRCAVTVPAVTMEQFIAVCRQGRLMPPKSTWFEPKIRSGLVIALLH